MSLNRPAILLVLAAAVGIAGYLKFGGGGEDGASGGASVASVAAPGSFSARAQTGQKTYEANCASRHGRTAAGQDGVTPSLAPIIYERGHHGDESFQRAVVRGVRAHHWRFGDMPPVDGLTRRDITAVVAYVRKLQRANGIR